MKEGSENSCYGKRIKPDEKRFFCSGRELELGILNQDYFMRRFNLLIKDESDSKTGILVRGIH